MKPICEILVEDEVNVYFNGLDDIHYRLLYEEYGILIEGSQFFPIVKLGRWDGKVRYFGLSGKTYLRLLDTIIPRVEALGYDISLVDKRPPVRPLVAEMTPNWFRENNLTEADITARDYQVDAVNALLTNGGGFVRAATGAGKTLITGAVTAICGKQGYKCMTIVPSVDLVNQTSAFYKLLGIDHGIYSGAVKDLAHVHCISTWQSLQNKPEIVGTFDAIIFDEAHGAKADVASKLLNEHGKNVPFKFGVTGTFPEPISDQFALKAAIGSIVYQIDAAYLIERGFLSTLEIQQYELVQKDKEVFPDYASERTYLSKNIGRLEVIADLIIVEAQKYGNTLVLVNSVKQGQALASMIEGAVFLHGADATDVRAEWYSVFATRDDLVVIATMGIASTGLSIDRIFHLMFVDIGKSFIKCIQAVGRGLRKGGDKSHVRVSDVHSSLTWSKKHARDRLKHYKNASYPVLPTAKIKLKT